MKITTEGAEGNAFYKETTQKGIDVRKTKKDGNSDTLDLDENTRVYGPLNKPKAPYP